MIIDKIENCPIYYPLHRDFRRAFEWLLAAEEEKLDQPGYTLEEGSLRVTVQRYSSKPRSECRAEGHEKYIDIQYVLKGCEKVGYLPRAAALAAEEYDPEGDIQFFRDDCELLTVPAGSFYIAFPQDIHLPKCHSAESEDVVKLVFKVRLEEAAL